ncbi:hypothetical protein K7X08_009879 [Anisodus acutangulus]|uniref:Uncharacterized protein n=1 Tax=Anisodus acutangulus TaxID=402998 RepID=A0A9Q1RV74_9SOLA|nr:hypothetical protein K7X08_009879 [Anisodus acutangulus]
MSRNRIANVPHILRSLDLSEWFFDRLKNGGHNLLGSYVIGSVEDMDEDYAEHLQTIQASRTPVYTLRKLNFLHGIGFGENKLTMKVLSQLHVPDLELFRRTYPSLIHDQAAEMIDSLHASAEYFQNILEKTSHQKHEYKKIKDLEGEIRVALQQAEDLLESNILEIMRERSSQQEEKNNGSKWTIHDEAWVLLRDLPQAIDKIDAVRKDLMRECSTSTNANAHSTGAVEDHFFKTGDCLSPKCASTALLRDITVGLDDALTKIIHGLLGSVF